MLKNKLRRKAALLVGLLATFLPFWILYPILAVVFLVVVNTAVNATAAVFVALLQGIIPFIFFVYVCKKICKKPTKKEMGAIKAMSALSTVPPSTRVSLPADTALHALNFLSPSTAEMSSEYNTSYILMTWCTVHKQWRCSWLDCPCIVWDVHTYIMLVFYTAYT